jgi:hypothetical protein
MTRLLAVIGVLVVPALAPSLEAQIAVSLSGAAAQVHSTALVDGVTEEIGGVWFGGALAVHLGPAVVRARALGGTMTPVGSSNAFERDGGELQGGLALHPTPWVSLDGSFTYRAFDSPVGFQSWTMPAVGVTLSPPLGDPDLRAYLRGSYLPSVAVSGREAPDLGLWAEGGVRAALRVAPIVIGLSYRFERYDFPTNTVTRVEQFDRLALEVGVRLGSGTP